ncbi:MAG: YHS domain-containing protein [Fimbriimonadaceae bacterium]|nr:YHS domain-containing protein [Alphaproteobacteria bacterium]
MGHNHRQHPNKEDVNSTPKWIPPNEDRDPVCGKIVATENAKSSVHAGHVFYFCSRDCREVFEAAPNLYISQSEPKIEELEHSHA